MNITDTGNIFSTKTNKLYSTIFESLVLGERFQDLEVRWEFDVNKADVRDDLDGLYDHRLLRLGGISNTPLPAPLPSARSGQTGG